MNLDHAQQLFIGEALELLAEMESLLLDVESQQAPIEQHIDAIFRAAHTIKGSAGLFGFNDIVTFTHNVESVLAKVRSEELVFDSAFAELILDCQNYMLTLVNSLDDKSQIIDDEQGKRLTQALTVYLEPSSPNSNVIVSQASAEHVPESIVWIIDIRYDEDVFKDGMDPASQVRYLQSFGKVIEIAITPRFSDDSFEPECCYLNMELIFEAACDSEKIKEAFEFIEHSSEVKVATVTDMLTVLEDFPEQKKILSEKLCRNGVTYIEYDKVDIQPEENLDKGQAAYQAQQLDTAAKVGVPAQQSQFKALKVDAKKLDTLITLIGELVTTGAENEVLVTELDNERLDESFSSMLTLVEQIRDSALSLRMVQIGESFNRLKRIVRDVSKELGKAIHLEISGSETELDKSMVEKLTDPLMHIVRNAIDHGIEEKDARLNQGKSEIGQLTLNAFHEAGAVVIEVKDDGAGLDAEKIRAKAIEKGLITPQLSLTQDACYKLIFEPGFSTAANVTNLSGRGVGMDVVKRNIEDLRGQINIQSVPGAGSTFRIRLPLTLAIIDGFQVAIADSYLVIPVSMIQECLSFDAGSLPNERNYFNLRGDVLPLIRLRDIFAITGSSSSQEHIVVVQFAGKRAGLVVDSLHGELQAVIKPLNKMFRAIKGVGGTTILGTGEVAFILDVPQLIEFAVRQETNKYADHPIDSKRVNYE
ncbi:chemotaxis protein CheA [Pseudoalteromonas mariniglutinosa]|uniref:chemotaxis protein CheA n=1 Tax=Pseudoalteromonas mariniglutinosa TaxID=206042 RepID=UPI00384E542C